MGKVTITKEDALRIVFATAPKYKELLSGRNLLFVCVDEHMHTSCLEVKFTASRFLHLTGFDIVNTKITAEDFLSRCLKRRLSLQDFEFYEDGTTELKMRALPLVMQKDLAARMVGDYNNKRPLLYTEKIAGGINACVGFVQDNGDGRYVPNTLLDADIRDETVRPLRIVATFRKRIADPAYQELAHIGKNVKWERITLPSEYSYLKHMIPFNLQQRP